MNRCAGVLFALATFVIASPASRTAHGRDAAVAAAAAALADLEREMLTGEIATFRLLFVGYDVVTQTRVTPELLPGVARLDRVISMSASRMGSLVSAIRKATLAPLDAQPDLRWGAVFLDARGNERHSIYLDGKYITGPGRRGMIDGHMVGLNGTLVGWFEEQAQESPRR